MHKIVKCTIKCLDNDVNVALLQIRSMPIGTALPSPATLLLNKLIRALLPQMNRETININTDDSHYKTLKEHPNVHIKDNETLQDSFSFSTGSTVVMQH